VLNSSGANLRAELNAAGTGISIHSKLSGSDFQIGENGGQTATQLGVRTFNRETRLDDLNYGAGVPRGEGFELPTIAGNDFTIRTRDGQTFNIDFDGTESLADVVSKINTATTVLGVPQVTANLAAPGNVLQLVDNTIPTVPGTSEFSITQAAGSSAAQYLGLIAAGQSSTATTGTTHNGNDDQYTDFTITVGGQDFGIDLSGAKTIGDVIDKINAIASGFAAGLASTGNGITITSGGAITITRQGESQTAERLGMISRGQSSVTANGAITSSDQSFLENDSVFNTLVRLRNALEANDLGQIGRALAMVSEDIDRVTFARADIGATAQGLEISQLSLQDEQVQLKAALSDEIDVDLVEAISELTSRQLAMQASLQVTANVMQLSLLDYL
jgi:flagellin-like hook-associated protein FlgL